MRRNDGGFGMINKQNNVNYKSFNLPKLNNPEKSFISAKRYMEIWDYKNAIKHLPRLTPNQTILKIQGAVNTFILE